MAKQVYEVLVIRLDDDGEPETILVDKKVIAGGEEGLRISLARCEEVKHTAPDRLRIIIRPFQ